MRNAPHLVVSGERDRFHLRGQGELPGRMSKRECPEGPGLLKAEIGRNAGRWSEKNMQHKERGREKEGDITGDLELA